MTWSVQRRFAIRPRKVEGTWVWLKHYWVACKMFYSSLFAVPTFWDGEQEFLNKSDADDYASARSAGEKMMGANL